MSNFKSFVRAVRYGFGGVTHPPAEHGMDVGRMERALEAAKTVDEVIDALYHRMRCDHDSTGPVVVANFRRLVEDALRAWHHLDNLRIREGTYEQWQTCPPEKVGDAIAWLVWATSMDEEQD